MSIFGPAAVTAARPGLEPAASLSVDDDHRVYSEYDDDFHDPCTNFRARRVSEHLCECLGTTTPSKECVLSGRTFELYKGSAVHCRCKTSAEVSREQSVFVRASALRFCTDILDKTAEAKGKLDQLRAKYTVDRFDQDDLDDYRSKYVDSEIKEESWEKIRERFIEDEDSEPEEKHLVEKAFTIEHPRDFVEDELGLTQNLCKEVLTGRSSEDQEWYSGATELSKHQNAMGFGHLDPLVTGSVESHRLLLDKVCSDECEDLVNTTLKNIEKMVKEDVGKETMRFEQSCADRVVRKVEAEVLGCCGRACAWNNRSCMAWPFFTKDQKVEWLEECCAEFNILNGSSRERMCNSVLTPKQVQLISEFNAKTEEGTDVGGAYTGQDPPLLWTQEGISEFKLNVKVNSEVSSDFLEKHPKIRRQGLVEGWLREEKLDEKGVRPPSSLIQGSSCNLKEMHSCRPNMRVSKMKSCHAGSLWEHSKKPEEGDPDTYCTSQTGTPVATPDDCILQPFPEAGNIIRRFFEYKNKETLKKEEDLSGAVPKHPIMCHVESDLFPCEGDFGREPLNIGQIVNGRDAFDDYLYWIKEEKAKERREELQAKLKK